MTTAKQTIKQSRDEMILSAAEDLFHPMAENTLVQWHKDQFVEDPSDWSEPEVESVIYCKIWKPMFFFGIFGIIKIARESKMVMETGWMPTAEDTAEVIAAATEHVYNIYPQSRGGIQWNY